MIFIKFWLCTLVASAASNSAPQVLITKNWGCGNYECCNFSYSWKVKKSTGVFEKPGHGQRIAMINPGMEVKVKTSTNFTTRGTLYLRKDKAGAKAGEQVYFYNRDSSQGVVLYSHLGKEIKSPNGSDFISTDMLKPECTSDKCVGEVVVPSKGETYLRIKTPNNKTGWVLFESLEPGC